MIAIFLLAVALINATSSVWVLATMPGIYSAAWLAVDLFLMASATFVCGIELGRRQ